MAGIDLFLIVADFIQVRLQSQIVIVGGAPLLLTSPFIGLYRVNDVSHAALAIDKQLSVFEVQIFYLVIFKLFLAAFEFGQTIKLPL